MRALQKQSDVIVAKNEPVLLTYREVAARCSLGINTVIKLSKESGALLKIGGSSRVQWDVFYKYLQETYAA